MISLGKKKTIAGFSTSMLVVFSLDEGNGKTEIVGNLNGKNKEATIKTGKQLAINQQKLSNIWEGN